MSVFVRSGLSSTGSILLAQSHTTLTKDDTDTTEATLWTYVLPGGLLGPSDSVRLTPRFGMTNNATTKSLRVKANGTALYSVSFTTQASLMTMILFSNRNALNSQVGVAQAGTVFSQNTATLTFTSIDTSADVTFTVTGQHGTAGGGTGTIRLESIIAELLKGP